MGPELRDDAVVEVYQKNLVYVKGKKFKKLF